MLYMCALYVLGLMVDHQVSVGCYFRRRHDSMLLKQAKSWGIML